jgi:putative ATP-binding cassette transporter
MYPQIEVHTGTAESPQTIHHDSEIEDAMSIAMIEYLAARHGLDSDLDYDGMLSRGEKQSLCFARMFLRQDVDLAILDEATSGMDEQREASLYLQIRHRIPCYVSVGHRKSLERYHTHKLVLEKRIDGGCSATVSRIHDSQPYSE